MQHNKHFSKRKTTSTRRVQSEDVILIQNGVEVTH